MRNLNLAEKQIKGSAGSATLLNSNQLFVNFSPPRYAGDRCCSDHKYFQQIIYIILNPEKLYLSVLCSNLSKPNWLFNSALRCITNVAAFSQTERRCASEMSETRAENKLKSK